MYVRVLVTPAAKKELITELSATNYKIDVKEPAERNLANQRIRILLAGIFDVSPSLVRLIAGHRSPRKVYTIETGA